MQRPPGWQVPGRVPGSGDTPATAKTAQGPPPSGLGRFTCSLVTSVSPAPRWDALRGASQPLKAFQRPRHTEAGHPYCQGGLGGEGGGTREPEPGHTLGKSHPFPRRFPHPRLADEAPAGSGPPPGEVSAICPESSKGRGPVRGCRQLGQLGTRVSDVGR